MTEDQGAGVPQQPMDLGEFAAKLGITPRALRKMVKPLFFALKESGRTEMILRRFDSKVNVTIR